MREEKVKKVAAAAADELFDAEKVRGWRFFPCILGVTWYARQSGRKNLPFKSEL